jgi:hypothetical protein
MSRISGELAIVDAFGEMFIPDVRITIDDPTYCYRPCRGYCSTVAVEDINEKIIGWMHYTDLPGGPYRDVTDWMEKTKYVIRTEK